MATDFLSTLTESLSANSGSLNLLLAGGLAYLALSKNSFTDKPEIKDEDLDPNTLGIDPIILNWD